MPQTAQIGAYLPEVQATEAIPRRVTPSLSGVSAGAGVTAIGTALQQSQEQDAIVQSSKAMAAARTTWTQEFIDRQQQPFQLGEDFSGKLMKDFKQYHDDTLKNTSDPYAKQFLDKQLTSFGSELAQKGQMYQAQAAVSTRVTTQQENNRQAGIAVATDPTQFGKARAEQLAAISEMKVDPEVKAQLAEHARSTMGMAAAKTLAENQPYNTLLALTHENTGNDALNSLTAAERLEIRDHVISAQRLLQAQEDHNMIMADKAQKKASDALSKKADDLLAADKLTPEWLHAHQNVLEAGEYRYFSRSLSKADKPERETSDPEIFSDLTLRAVQGDDVKDEARKQLLAGNLKASDFTKIVTDVSSERPGWYKRGASYIREALAVSTMNPDPAGQRSLANALSDFQEWGAKHPDAKDNEARMQVETIAQHYQIIPQDKMELGMRAPRMLVGTRMQPDLKATVQKTLEAVKSGQLTEEEAAQDWQLIQKYQKIEAAKGNKSAAKP